MISYTPLYHGITVQDAADLLGVKVGTVRSWLSRYDLPRTGDGGICPLSLVEWYDYVRDAEQGRRRAGTRP